MLALVMWALILPPGCLSSRRPPSERTAVRRPTIWDHLFSDREEERKAIASRLRAEENRLAGRKASLMQAVRTQELEAQLAPNSTEQAARYGMIDELNSKVDGTEEEREWVDARRNQNHHDWEYWPNRDAYRKPSAPAGAPIVEVPVREL